MGWLFLNLPPYNLSSPLTKGEQCFLQNSTVRCFGIARWVSAYVPQQRLPLPLLRKGAAVRRRSKDVYLFTYFPHFFCNRLLLFSSQQVIVTAFPPVGRRLHTQTFSTIFTCFASLFFFQSVRFYHLRHHCFSTAKTKSADFLQICALSAFLIIKFL